ncbi:hypothetical protein ETF27_00790 [Prevotella brunnea]|uniref:Uncharacterized protein n=1 Tax=Prevotella brunnea TaxID=2508867 RepID=A0A5C8GM73_9BACT|nr:hypothetical protein [Prevotella brunnea]TXJ63261.1 hypothetical protein ETF27_00790 [Prevotella brunnea]
MLPLPKIFIAKIYKMVETLLLSMLIIAIAIVLLSIRILFKKGGQFKSQHIHDNKALRNQGIHCVLDQDKEARALNRAC